MAEAGQGSAVTELRLPATESVVPTPWLNGFGNSAVRGPEFKVSALDDDSGKGSPVLLAAQGQSRALLLQRTANGLRGGSITGPVYGASK